MSYFKDFVFDSPHLYNNLLVTNQKSLQIITIMLMFQVVQHQVKIYHQTWHTPTNRIYLQWIEPQISIHC